MTKVYKVEKIGPYAVRDDDGLVASGKKAEVMDLARSHARRVAADGQDARIEVIDALGRVVRVEPFYVELAPEPKPEDEIAAAKAAVS